MESECILSFYVDLIDWGYSSCTHSVSGIVFCQCSKILGIVPVIFSWFSETYSKLKMQTHIQCRFLMI